MWSRPFILLVEDNPHDAELTQIALKKGDFELPIHHIKDGEEALNYLLCKGSYAPRRPEEFPTAIILDLKLPKVNGFDILSEVRKNALTKDIPVIILTSSNEQADIERCQSLGIHLYVQKPVNFKDFKQALKSIIYILNQISPMESPLNS